MPFTLANTERGTIVIPCPVMPCSKHRLINSSRKWNGDDPTPVIPDELENKASEIVEYVTVLWSAWGGTVKFYPERTAYSNG